MGTLRVPNGKMYDVGMENFRKLDQRFSSFFFENQPLAVEHKVFLPGQ